MRKWVQSLASLSGLEIGVVVSCGIGCRHGSDPVLLCLWHRLAVVTLIQHLAWELPYGMDAAQKCTKDKKIKKKKKERYNNGKVRTLSILIFKRNKNIHGKSNIIYKLLEYENKTILVNTRTMYHNQASSHIPETIIRKSTGKNISFIVQCNLQVIKE